MTAGLVWKKFFSVLPIHRRIMENIEIRLITPTDKEPLIDFLKYHIPRNGTPVYVSLNFTKDDVNYLAHLKAHEALMQPDKPMSYLAMDKETDRIIAISTACIVDPSDKSGTPEFQSSIPVGPELQKLIDFWHLMGSGLEEFLPPNYPGPYVMGELGLVDPKYQRLGLIEKMFDMVYERGWKEFGCKYQFGLCTSYKSISLCEKHGWTTSRWIRYEDYCLNGARVFKFGADSKQIYAKFMMADLEHLIVKSGQRRKAKL